MIEYVVSISSKKVAPATSITTVVHDEKYNPNFAFVASVSRHTNLVAFNDDQHDTLSETTRNSPKHRAVPGPVSRRVVCLFKIPSCRTFKLISWRFRRAGLAGLKKYAESPEGQQHKAFYDKHIAKISALSAILKGTAPDEDKQQFFVISASLWENIKLFVVEILPGAIQEGPFIAGATPGVDDYHVGAWLARIAFLSGAKKSEEGVAALEKRFGPIPEKVRKYWAGWIVRDSWTKAYPENDLH